MDLSPAPDHWDFYPSRINDAAASVMVNLWFGDHAPIDGFSHLLWVFVGMEEPGEHGMGGDADFAALGSLEDALSSRVQAEVAAHYVARIRGEGFWQLYFYGRGPDGFEDTVGRFMSAYPGRRYDAGVRQDPEWKIYRDVFYPDEERWRWIWDNRVVEALRAEGDPLTDARRVDHWIYFKDAAAVDLFEREARSLGFETQEDSKALRGDGGKYGIQIYRDDFVDIVRIHDVVMDLTELAERHGGEYDGWETEIRPAPGQ